MRPNPDREIPQPDRIEPDAVRTAIVVAFGFVIASIVWFGLVGHAPVPMVTVIGIRVDDLVCHIVSFACLSFLATVFWRPSLRLVLVLGGGAAALEGLQCFLPDRVASLLDLSASLTGIAGGLWIQVTVGFHAPDCKTGSAIARAYHQAMHRRK